MGWRNLTIDGERYSWRCGSMWMRIEMPSGQTVRTTIWDMKGITVDEFERGKWKKTRAGMVLPNDVRDFIIKNKEKQK